jgi:hypothetical protein
LHRLFLGVLLLGILFRVAVLSVPGTGDVSYFMGWSIASWQLGVKNVYPPYPSESAPLAGYYNLPVNYPPGTAYYLGLMGGLFLQLPEALQTKGVLTGIVKLPTALFELLGALAICGYIGRKWGERQKVLAFAAYWLNPAVLIAGPLLGYQDGVTVALVCFSLLFALKSRLVPATVLLIGALLVKQLALFAFPVLFVFLVRSAERRKALLAMAAVPLAAALILAPYLLSGRVMDVYHHLSGASVHGSLSANALNFWWLVSAWLQAANQTMEGIPIVRQLLGVKLAYLESSSIWLHQAGRACYVGFTLVNLICLYRRSNSRNAYVFAMGMQFYGYFMLMTGVHENHLLYALPFMALLMFESREFRYLYYAISFMVFINLYWFYGFTGDALARNMEYFSILSVLFAFANTVTFGWACVVMLRGKQMQGEKDDLLPELVPLCPFLPAARPR